MFESVSAIQNSLASAQLVDLDNIFLPQINSAYQDLITRLLIKNLRLAGLPHDSLALRSWRPLAEEEISKALQVYYQRKLFLQNQNLNAYLIASVRNFIRRIFWQSHEKKLVLICPACRKIDDHKVFLSSEERMWRCLKCTEKLSENISVIEKQFRQAYALHSRTGFACPECSLFLPRSIAQNNQICCPNSECSFAGLIVNCRKIAHPIKVSVQLHKSLDSILDVDNRKRGLGVKSDYKFLSSRDSSFSEDFFLVKSKYQAELKVLQEAIQSGIDFTARQNLPATKAQKNCFYQAFSDVAEEHPDEMISYLIHNQIRFDFPIQSKIFQRFLFHLESLLPYEFTFAKGQTYRVESLTDPHLALFDGESSFEAQILPDYTIPNQTKERYFSENFKDYGPYFLGKILSIQNLETQEELLPLIQENSFVKITMASSLSVGTPVLVRHYRLVPHYTMGILIHLQKIRKHLGQIVAKKKKNLK